MIKKKINKEKFGIVTSDKMNKTIIVTERKKVKHKTYNKLVLKNKKYFVHDENNVCELGDFVKIIETRPLSKNKHWRLLKIEKKNK